MKKISFVSKCYIDSNFSSGGVKLNFFVLKELSKLGYVINLFSKFYDITDKNIFENVFNFSEYSSYNHEILLSDKACVPSDITYIHDHSYLYRQKFFSNKVSFWFCRLFERKKYLKRISEFNQTKVNLQNTKIIIASSKVLRDDLIKNYEVDSNKIVIIPPPVEKYIAQKRKDNDVVTFGISAVGFVRKGGYLTLKAIKILKNKGFKFKVKFIYPSRNIFVEFLIKLYGITDYCEFLPLQKNMGDFYNSIDCLLMPSLIEPFGMVATEALSTGCPVITGSHCGASDIITDNVNGFLYSGNKSVKSLSNVMEFVLNKKDLSSMQSACINSVIDFNINSFVNKYIDLLSSLE